MSESQPNRSTDLRSKLGSIWARPKPGAERQPLSRDQIVRVAIELADSDGLTGVSTRRIAGEIGAGATSLSWHVGSKDDLYELMFDAALGEIDLPEPTGDWRRDLHEIATVSRDLFNRHPWLVLLGIQPGLGPNTRRYGELGMRVLSEYGLDREARTEVLAMLNNYVVGFAHRYAAWCHLRQRAGLPDEEWENELQRYLEEARRDDPDLAADIESRLNLTSEASFEIGLACLIEGVGGRFLHDADSSHSDSHS